jgi:hypothetical protein
MEKLSYEAYEQAINNLCSSDYIQKARPHKYYKREGSPGNYKYYYTEEEYKKAKNIPEPEKRGSREIKLAEKVKSILKERGVDKAFNVSNTDFGTSVYFTVMGEDRIKFTLRISDHSVQNKERILNEHHASHDSDPKMLADLIERTIHPERYEAHKVGEKHYPESGGYEVMGRYENGYVWQKESREANENWIKSSEGSGDIKVLSKEFIRESKSGKKVYKVVFEKRVKVKSEPVYGYSRKNDTSGTGLQKVELSEYIREFKNFESPERIGAWMRESRDYYKKASEGASTYIEENIEVEVAINTYTNNGYRAVRGYLTDPDKYDPENFLSDIDKEDVQGVAENLSKFISDNKIEDNLYLRRGIKGEGVNFFNSLKVGEIYEDKSFTSTSLIQLDHFGDYKLSILAKKGSSVACIDNPGEREFLIDKGSKFRVLDKKENGLIVELL